MNEVVFFFVVLLLLSSTENLMRLSQFLVNLSQISNQKVKHPQNKKKKKMLIEPGEMHCHRLNVTSTQTYTSQEPKKLGQWVS